MGAAANQRLRSDPSRTAWTALTDVPPWCKVSVRGDVEPSRGRMYLPLSSRRRSYGTARTLAHPPHTVRRPRRVPLPRLKGARRPERRSACVSACPAPADTQAVSATLTRHHVQPGLLRVGEGVLKPYGGGGGDRQDRASLGHPDRQQRRRVLGTIYIEFREFIFKL